MPHHRQTVVFSEPTGKPSSPKPTAEERPGWAPFPLGFVQWAETAAALLQMLNNRDDVQARLDDPLLRRRYEHALVSARLMLDSLKAR